MGGSRNGRKRNIEKTHGGMGGSREEAESGTFFRGLFYLPPPTRCVGTNFFCPAQHPEDRKKLVTFPHRHAASAPTFFCHPQHPEDRKMLVTFPDRHAAGSFGGGSRPYGLQPNEVRWWWWWGVVVVGGSAGRGAPWNARSSAAHCAATLDRRSRTARARGGCQGVRTDVLLFLGMAQRVSDVQSQARTVYRCAGLQHRRVTGTCNYLCVRQPVPVFAIKTTGNRIPATGYKRFPAPETTGYKIRSTCNATGYNAFLHLKRRVTRSGPIVIKE